VLHRRKKSKGVKEMPNFFAAMQAVDQPLEPVFCGGTGRSVQEREQCPRRAISSRCGPARSSPTRANEATLVELDHAGFKLVAATNLLAGQETLAGGERGVVTIEGSELVRGVGARGV